MYKRQFDIVCEVDLTFMKEWTSVAMMNINKDVEIKTIHGVDVVHFIRKSKEGIRSSILFAYHCFQRLLKFHELMDNIILQKCQKHRDKQFICPVTIVQLVHLIKTCD